MKNNKYQTQFNTKGFKEENNNNIACRICGDVAFPVIDFGHHPFANALQKKITDIVKTYPLALNVCSNCAMGQLTYCADSSELYEDYLYVTPQSVTISNHYHNIIKILNDKMTLNDTTNLLEIGSNMGGFLQIIKPYVKSILGIDPAIDISKTANENGIPTVSDYFNKSSANKILQRQGKKDVIIARHCFAHNEKPWLMLDGVKEVLKDDGIFLVENAYFLDSIQNYAFDQIYHEHMYFYTVRSISQMLKNTPLELVDVLRSPIHGGTIIFIIKFRNQNNTISRSINKFLEKENNMHMKDFYNDFVIRIENNKRELCKLIVELSQNNKIVHAYGASAKSTMLLNYYQITNKTVPFIVDSTKIKEGKYIPIVNMQVISESNAENNQPDYYLLTSWNYKDEIINKVRSWGNYKSKFILPHPVVKILDD